MDSRIQAKINTLKTHITNAYTSIVNKGVTAPTNKNTYNLDAYIRKIRIKQKWKRWVSGSNYKQQLKSNSYSAFKGWYMTEYTNNPNVVILNCAVYIDKTYTATDPLFIQLQGVETWMPTFMPEHASDFPVMPIYSGFAAYLGTSEPGTLAHSLGPKCNVIINHGPSEKSGCWLCCSECTQAGWYGFTATYCAGRVPSV